MVAKVALVRTTDGMAKAFRHALDLIGGIYELNDGRDVAVKVGVYDARNLNYPTVEAVRMVVDSFTRPGRVLIVESDNHQGKAGQRLRLYEEVFSGRVMPFSLSDDSDAREVSVCGETVRFSHVLFKPNVLVSLHVLRVGTSGSIFKNLLGLVPDIRKERFHSRLGEALIDMSEAVGGIDLSVIDGTYMYGGEWREGEPLDRKRQDLLVVGRDAVAVEAVGSVLAGGNPLSIPSVMVAKRRGLGEADISRIEVLGEQIEDFK